MSAFDVNSLHVPTNPQSRWKAVTCSCLNWVTGFTSDWLSGWTASALYWSSFAKVDGNFTSVCFRWINFETEPQCTHRVTGIHTWKHIRHLPTTLTMIPRYCNRPHTCTFTVVNYCCTSCCCHFNTVNSKCLIVWLLARTLISSFRFVGSWTLLSQITTCQAS